MYPVLLEERRKAERYIFMEYFIVEKGEMWDSIQMCIRDSSRSTLHAIFFGIG